MHHPLICSDSAGLLVDFEQTQKLDSEITERKKQKDILQSERLIKNIRHRDYRDCSVLRVHIALART